MHVRHLPLRNLLPHRLRLARKWCDLYLTWRTGLSPAATFSKNDREFRNCGELNAVPAGSTGVG